MIKNKAKAINNINTFQFNKSIFVVFFVLLLSTESYCKNLDSVKVISYDLGYIDKFSHVSISDFEEFLDKSKSYADLYGNFCIFTITNPLELNRIDQSMADLKPLENITKEIFNGMYVRICMKLYYRDSIVLIGIQPKILKSIYIDRCKYKFNGRFIRYILKEINGRFKNGECKNNFVQD